jgi:hypothetical protein
VEGSSGKSIKKWVTSHIVLIFGFTVLKAEYLQQVEWRIYKIFYNILIQTTLCYGDYTILAWKSN